MTTQQRWQLVRAELGVEAESADEQQIEQHLPRWWEDATHRAPSDEFLAGLYLRVSIIKFLQGRVRMRVDRQLGSDRISNGQLLRNLSTMLLETNTEIKVVRQGDGPRLISLTPLNALHVEDDLGEARTVEEIES